MPNGTKSTTVVRINLAIMANLAVQDGSPRAGGVTLRSAHKIAQTAANESSVNSTNVMFAALRTVAVLLSNPQPMVSRK